MSFERIIKHFAQNVHQKIHITHTMIPSLNRQFQYMNLDNIRELTM